SIGFQLDEQIGTQTHGRRSRRLRHVPAAHHLQAATRISNDCQEGRHSRQGAFAGTSDTGWSRGSGKGRRRFGAIACGCGNRGNQALARTSRNDGRENGRYRLDRKNRFSVSAAALRAPTLLFVRVLGSQIRSRWGYEQCFERVCSSPRCLHLSSQSQRFPVSQFQGSSSTRPIPCRRGARLNCRTSTAPWKCKDGNGTSWKGMPSRRLSATKPTSSA